MHAWHANPHLEILGNPQAKQHLPIFSFRVKDAEGKLIHHQLFTRMLSDLYGIQARGGCACARAVCASAFVSRAGGLHADA
ncbi:Cysteine desulfurase [Acetobacter malorum]|uniref:Cysteine desulfurase n=1 Tax=Acetobacter malorum TaxID=178901 RepID=A0A177GEM7_9PROT|nr:Cysteine desulfurase [Acetobacter malorum]